MKKLVLTGLVIAGVTLAAQPVIAKGGKMIDKMFEKADSNSDGAISKSEFLANAEERFSKMDLDGSGEVTKEEAQNAMASMRDKRKQKKEDNSSGGSFGNE